MRCEILFSGKNKKNIINLSSGEFTRRVVKVKSFYLEVGLHSAVSSTSDCKFR